MKFPTIDILVPIWNNPFETRACLAAILATSPSARLIIVDNGSSRETELMLEEFSESLGDSGLFIKSEKNIGLVAAINLGLARSDSDYTIIVRPNVLVHEGWLEDLVSAAESTGAGILSPIFTGKDAPNLPKLIAGCTIMESCKISFSALLLRTEMRMLVGSFDETLDGDEWCLQEFVRRAAESGYRTCMTANVNLRCFAAQQFGSAIRRKDMIENSRNSYISRWGLESHYCVYFGKDIDLNRLSETISAILENARLGNKFSLLLHRRQYYLFRKMGWNALHTGIEIISLSFLFPIRDIQSKLAALRLLSPDLIAVRGSSETVFPDCDDAISLLKLLKNNEEV